MIWWVLFLFAGGMVLILAEFIIPGAICGIVGGVLVLTSCGLGVYAYPDNWFFIVLLEGVGVCAATFVGLVIFPKTRLAKLMLLQDTQPLDEGWVAAESDESLVGAEGKVFTALRPAGTIIVGDRRIGAVANGDYIEKDALVRVIEVHGNRIVVEEATRE
jgi:membrane-bound serine protease (ClpP class)